MKARGTQPGLQFGQLKTRGTARTETIRLLIERERAKGNEPTIAAVAKLFAMSEDRVEHHFRILGMLP